MTFRHILAAGAAIASLSVAGPALADIQFFLGNVPGNLDTILFDAADDGSDLEVLGKSDEGWDVLLTGEENIIATGGPGQAWVVGTDDGGLTFLNISTPGSTFTAAEININVPNGGGPPQAWSITLGGVDSDGTAFSQFFGGITNDQFFNFVATNGQVITSIDFRTSQEVALGQLRLGGLTAVPEPATWAMMIIGFGGVGALMRRKRGRFAFAG
ncbi:PEPxxWA-CTERM sorting domain-containing protein [Phenylobacterium sp.]|uniref:PEPxxWA-CTERM sorting domain-containing protein n=1 Tax=Phenylobacterium sp. TaxID=1871053 RepID=UPI0025D858E9|nr:PEPxxWA-CTERM sorting domain-containing protein [Phenylobacterium sp.]